MTIPGNPYAKGLESVSAGTQDGAVLASALLAVAHEQHRAADAQERQATALERRVRLAAITAMSKGITLPPDLEDLTTETPS